MKRLFLLLALVAMSNARAGDVRLEIDKKSSRIEYTVKTTASTFTGKLTAYDLAVDVDPATRRVAHTQLRFRFTDLDSGHTKRDADMRTWQGTDQFPEVVFTLVAIEPSAGGKSTARGQLIFHGLTRELTFPVTIASTPDNQFTIDGETSLDCHDFGLPVIRKFLVMKVDPVVQLRWHLQGTPAR